MGKKRAQLNKKDIRHLKDFGEIHPADLESQSKKQKLQEFVQKYTFEIYL